MNFVDILSPACALFLDFDGTLAELAFCADRAYMLALPDDAAKAPRLQLSEFNFGYLPMVNDQSRLQRRFYEEAGPMEAVRSAIGKALDADAAFALGLVTGLGAMVREREAQASALA